MNYLNARTRNLRQGAIRAMFDRASTLTGVISMGIGEPDMPTPAAVCAAGKEALDRGMTHYTPNAGLPALRKAVAERSTVRDVGYDPLREIIITNGGMGALSLLMAVVLDPGDEVLLQDPQWLNYAAQVEYYGGRVVRVPTRAEERFTMRPEAVESRITPKTKILMLNSPNNPTGFVMDPDSLAALADLACQYDLLVVADEVYNTLLYGDAANRTIASLPGMKARTVVVNSFSKSYAMTGWRIGYAAGPAEIIDRMTKCQENFNACANAPGQCAAIYALEHPELSEALRDVFAERRRITLSGLDRIPGISYLPPDGAFYVFPSIAAFGLSDTVFCSRLLEEQRLVCIPGSAFGPCGAGHIRMAYTTGTEQLLQGLDRLAAFCKTLL